jgi:hypothetical protein
MAKLDLESFAEKEVARIYIADRLREAKRVEITLSEHGIDYAVEVEPFSKVVLGVLRIESSGAAFYVLSGQAPFARQALASAGLITGLVEEETD